MNEIIGYYFNNSKNLYYFYEDGIARIKANNIDKDIGLWKIQGNTILVKWQRDPKDTFSLNGTSIISKRYNWEAQRVNKIEDKNSGFIKKDFSLLFELEKDMFDFFDSTFFILLLESGKAEKNYSTKNTEQSEYIKELLEKHKNIAIDVRVDTVHHHTGIINDILIDNRKNRKLKPPIDLIKKFEKDIDHGIFHGIMTAFISFLLYRNEGLKLDDIQNNSEYIKNLLSCLLHDFAKPFENHDNYIKNFFPNLNEEVYTHSNPPKEMSNRKLIISDRCELMRYDDYLSWVDTKKIYSNLPTNMIEKINFFYNNLRKKFEKLILITADPIISCTLESGFFPKGKPTHYPWDYICSPTKTYCVYDGYFEDLPYGWAARDNINGVMSIYDLNQETENFPLIRDHVNLNESPQQDINSWIFLNKRKDKDPSLSEHYLGVHNIYTINTQILLKLISLKRSLFSRILIHSKP